MRCFSVSAVQKLHGDERMTFVLADFVDRADVGMVQGRRSTRLAPKAFESLRVLGKFVRKKFQGNEAPELGVFGLIDHTHAAAAELFDDAVVRDGLADHVQILWREAMQVNESRAVAVAQTVAVVIGFTH